MVKTEWTDLEGLKASLLGATQPSSSGFVSVELCAGLLARADELFKPYLAPLGHTVRSYAFPNVPHLRLDPECLAQWLNRMHPDMTPDTMSQRSTVDHVQACVEAVLDGNVPGDLIETGVWKGGLTVLMRAVLKLRGASDRRVWVADSFAGLPEPDPATALGDAILHFLMEPVGRFSISRERVERTFSKYGLLDDQVRFLPGWFADTLPSAPIERLAVLRLDGDLYDSTMCALVSLYPRLSAGGIVIIDDYGLPFGCRQAVDEYRATHGIDRPIQWVNDHVVCWRH